MDHSTSTCAGPAPAARKWTGFTQVPDQVDALPKATEVFFRRLKKLTRFAPYCALTIDEIAAELDMKPGTVKRHRRIILSTQVPGFSHCFATKVGFRLYLVNKLGLSTAPVDLERSKNEPAAAQKCAVPAAAPTIESVARVVVVQRDSDQNDCAETLERQRPDESLITCPIVLKPADTPVAAVEDRVEPAIAEPAPPPAATLEAPGPDQVPAPSSAAADPEIVLTPKVETLAPPPFTDEQLQVLASLSPEVRERFYAQKPAKRARQLRDIDVLGPQKATAIIMADLRIFEPTVQPRPMPETLPELIAQLPESDGSGIHAGAEWIVRALNDSKYRIGHEMLLRAVWRRKVDAKAVADACWQAMNRKGVRDRPRYFWRIVRNRTGIKGEDLNQLASGGTS